MDGRFYPSGNDGAMDKVGVGAGEGKNVNIPWPTKGMGDGDYMFAFQNVVMPIAQEFDPDLVIVAAGFDAAAGDELGWLLCYACLLCSHDAHAYVTRQRQNCGLSRRRVQLHRYLKIGPGGHQNLDGRTTRSARSHTSDGDCNDHGAASEGDPVKVLEMHGSQRFALGSCC